MCCGKKSKRAEPKRVRVSLHDPRIRKLTTKELKKLTEGKRT